MTKKFHILLIILTLGFFATPTLTYACGTKSDQTEKSCCKKSETEKDSKKDCCKSHKSKNDKDKNGCDGKCNNSNCSCPTNHCAFTIPFWIETKVKTCSNVTTTADSLPFLESDAEVKANPNIELP